MITDREKMNLEEQLTQCLIFHHTSHMTWPAIETPDTDRLRHGTAFYW